VLADGERSLAQGAPAHCHFWYRREAIDALMRVGDCEGAAWQATALESFAQAEDVPWVDFQVRRGRALAKAGRGHADVAELVGCRERAVELALPGAIPAIDDALAKMAVASQVKS